MHSSSFSITEKINIFLENFVGGYHWKGSWNSMQHWFLMRMSSTNSAEKEFIQKIFLCSFMNENTFVYSFSIYFYFLRSLYAYYQKKYKTRNIKLLGERFCHVVKIYFYKLMKFDAKIHKKRDIFMRSCGGKVLRWQ